MCRNLTEAEDQGFNKGEVEGLKDMGDQHLLRLSESPGDTLPPHSLEAMLEQQPEGEDREEGHRVYLPGQGWTTISGVLLACVKGLSGLWWTGGMLQAYHLLNGIACWIARHGRLGSPCRPTRCRALRLGILWGPSSADNAGAGA